LRPADAQAHFETKLLEFLLRFVQEFPTVKSLLKLIPKVTAVPITRPNLVAFKPTNYLPANRTVPAMYSSDITQVILTAMKEIKRQATLAYIDQKSFGGTYTSFYIAANSQRSVPSTFFVDELRGVSVVLRDGRRALYAENPPQRNYKPMTNAMKERNNIRRNAKGIRGRSDIALGLAKAFACSNQPFDLSKVLEQDPNNLQDNLKNAFKDELGIDENWLPRDGVYVDRHKKVEDIAMKLNIARDVRSGLIVSEAILKGATKYASHMSLTHPYDMKLVNCHPGILVAAKTLQEKTDLFEGIKLKKFDTHVWVTMAWLVGFEHIRIKHYGHSGVLPLDLKIYANIFYPDNVYYKKLKCHFMKNIYCVRNHAMSARIPEMAIGNVWLELTWRGQGVAPEIDTIKWNPPTVEVNFDKQIITDPPPRT
jgi:hypothetical protein